MKRDILTQERGTVFKKWTDRAPVCVAYPNTYYIGMSNLAVHLLYRLLNGRPEIVCERIFIEGDEKPLSVESGRPLDSFELIFLTLSFEMDYVNIPRMLRSASIPPVATERTGSHPIVVAGGILAMANPEPVSPFVDIFLLGDIEACIPPFIERYLQIRGKKRAEMVDELSAGPGAYNPGHLGVQYGEDGTIAGFIPPSFSVETVRNRGRELATSAIVSGRTEFSDMVLVEGTRGCPSQCAFCLAGNIYPFVSDRLSHLDKGVKDIGLIGGGISYHPHLADIIKTFKEMGIRVHLPSLRLDEVPLEVLELVKDTIKTLTFGIEAGSERLRRCIGKPITDEEIYQRVAAIAAVKAFHFKFYFMVGLPGERRDDVEAIVDLVKHILHVIIKKSSARGRVGSITVHASPFVPKPATPFQWLAMEDMKELKERISLLKREFGKMANTYFTHESVKYSFLQGVLARGDRRLKDVIVQLSEGMSLTKIMRESAINLNFYATRERRKDEIFPWDFIYARTEKERLHARLNSCLASLS